jgi:hypothetical protein
MHARFRKKKWQQHIILSPFSVHFYTLAQHKSNGKQLVLSIIAEPKGEGRGEEAVVREKAWIAASAASWRTCTGFRGTPSALRAMKVPWPSSLSSAATISIKMTVAMVLTSPPGH